MATPGDNLPGTYQRTAVNGERFLHDNDEYVDLVGFLQPGITYPAFAPLMVTDAATREWGPWDGTGAIQGFTGYAVDLASIPAPGGMAPAAGAVAPAAPVQHDIIVSCVFNPNAVDLTEATVTAPAAPTIDDVRTNLLTSGMPLYPREYRA